MLRTENTNLKKQVTENDEKILSLQKTLSPLQNKNGKDDACPPANVTQVYKVNFSFVILRKFTKTNLSEVRM